MSRYVSIDRRFDRRRLNKVGVSGTVLFVHPASTNSIEIWSVDTLYPSSWQQLMSIPLENVIYAIPSCSSNSPHIFVLFAGIESADRDIFDYALFRLNYETCHVEKYRFNQEKSEPAACVLPLETLAMHSTNNRVVLFDRSIVMGPIPFWEIHVDHDDVAFHLTRRDIKDVSSEQQHCTRFPIPFDATARIFGRLKDDSSLTIYDESSEKWVEYQMESGQPFDLPPISVRGLRETYGSYGHRMGAIETQLTFHCDGATCIARIVKNNRHHFYSIQLDHTNRTFNCSQRGSVIVHEGVDRMFYSLCSPQIFVFIGIRNIGIAYLQPPRLDELCIWKVQRMFNKSPTRVLTSSLSPQEIREMCKTLYYTSRNAE